MVVPFSEVFIPSHSTHEVRVFGWGYKVYIILGTLLYVALIVDAVSSIRGVAGSKRLELQIWLLGGCSVAVGVLALMALRTFTGDSRYVGLQPLMVLLFYAGTAIAITTHRLFDARQIILLLGQKCALVGTVSVFVYFLIIGFNSVLPAAMLLVVTTAAALWCGSRIQAFLDRYMQFYPQGTTVRHAAFEAAQKENRVVPLKAAFVGILKGWGKSDTAILISGEKKSVCEDSGCLTGQQSVDRAIRQLKWATPERLVRERADRDREALALFMKEHALGVVVITEGPSLVTVVGVGMDASRRPYTYPQVVQLIELGSIIEGALERAYIAERIQHTEQLATVGLLGASVAHEIRNPLVSIKTFVQLLPSHYNDLVFREKFFHLIGGEVARIDQLTEQLLDLSTPRVFAAEFVQLHPVLVDGLELVAAKATHRNVEVITEFVASQDVVYTDPSAAKQVLLNLCFNAIQAVEMRDIHKRWIKISTRLVSAGFEMAVTDNGPGVAPEMRSRLFRTFQTTKSSGFGLGLAICSDILANLNASISVDPPMPGCGATFRVIFPCQPLSS